LLNVFAAEDIGARIAKARTEAGLTQEDLADVIGISTRQLQNLEAGESKPYKHLERIAEATKRPLHWFIEDGASPDDDHLRALVREELAGVRQAVERILALLESPPRDP